VQRSRADHGGRPCTAIEYIGFDEDTRTLCSVMLDSAGSKFAYTWRVEGDTLTTWFGDEGSDNLLTATFSPDGGTVTGGWQWPDGAGGTDGYRTTMTRVTAAPGPRVPAGALLLELVPVPVTDIDRAKACEVGEVEDSGGVRYARFNDPDGSTWCLQHLPWR
jgi:hypothetical protein